MVSCQPLACQKQQGVRAHQESNLRVEKTTPLWQAFLRCYSVPQNVPTSFKISSPEYADPKKDITCEKPYWTNIYRELRIKNLLPLGFLTLKLNKRMYIVKQKGCSKSICFQRQGFLFWSQDYRDCGNHLLVRFLFCSVEICKTKSFFFVNRSDHRVFFNCVVIHWM